MIAPRVRQSNRKERTLRARLGDRCLRFPHHGKPCRGPQSSEETSLNKVAMQLEALRSSSSPHRSKATSGAPFFLGGLRIYKKRSSTSWITSSEETSLSEVAWRLEALRSSSSPQNLLQSFRGPQVQKSGHPLLGLPLFVFD